MTDQLHLESQTSREIWAIWIIIIWRERGNARNETGQSTCEMKFPRWPLTIPLANHHSSSDVIVCSNDVHHTLGINIVSKRRRLRRRIKMFRSTVFDSFTHLMGFGHRRCKTIEITYCTCITYPCSWQRRQVDTHLYWPDFFVSLS